ncbi:hypothetical protein [Hirschia litorea]|uniref:Urate oxidase N-terminal domain-containing protein n=1 Tax=Hirschia litorea TaxID=1199156 RepID=A0ABW2IGR3_9PROT
MGEFLATNELHILRWLHIVAMVYWLGGEWGVFQTSYKVVNHKLPLEERARHMSTAYRIDIMARTGIISLLPLGLHMGYLWGVQPLGGGWLVAMWLLWVVWMVITWGAFANRTNELGNKLALVEDWTRYPLIPILIISALSSLMGNGPFAAGEGQMWFSAKILTYGLALIIGVILRIIMHEWRKIFPILAQGPNAELEAKLDKSIQLGRNVAYLYWVLILTTAFFGAVKPF